jgi:hypothetical protein
MRSDPFFPRPFSLLTLPKRENRSDPDPPPENPIIKWTKDRGTEPQRPHDQFPWFWDGDTCQWTRIPTRLVNPNCYEVPGHPLGRPGSIGSCARSQCVLHGVGEFLGPLAADDEK